jgi:PAS domain-containing protein
MPQAIELILMRQLATYLGVPIFIVGADEQLLYYNEAAEMLLGRPYGDAGQMSLQDLTAIFQVVDAKGAPLAWDEQPLAIALRNNRPAHTRIRFHALDGVMRDVEVTAFPLEGQGGRRLGAAAIFWETAR